MKRTDGKEKHKTRRGDGEIMERTPRKGVLATGHDKAGPGEDGAEDATIEERTAHGRGKGGLRPTHRKKKKDK